MRWLWSIIFFEFNRGLISSLRPRGHIIEARTNIARIYYGLLSIVVLRIKPFCLYGGARTYINQDCYSVPFPATTSPFMLPLLPLSSCSSVYVEVIRSGLDARAEFF